MSHQDDDPRVRRTRLVIRDAFLDLVDLRGFNAITIGEIAQRAGVNRATFYRHYADKYALVEDIYEQASAALSSELGPPGLELDAIDPEPTPAAWVQLFAHFERHAAIYRALLGKNGSAWFATRMRDSIQGALLERERQRELLPAHQGKPRQTRMPKDIGALLIATLATGVVAWWLEHGDSYSPEQIATWFRIFVLRGYAYALGEAPAP
jgi:AcrR family transcriptional regulator